MHFCQPFRGLLANLNFKQFCRVIFHYDRQIGIFTYLIFFADIFYFSDKF